MNEITGGQWFAPVIILLLVLAGISAMAVRKSKNDKLKFGLNFLMYFMMIVALIIFWIWYFKGEFNLFGPVIYTFAVINLMLEQLSKKYKDIILYKFRLRYSWLKQGIASVYMLFVVLLMLVGSQFSIEGWIISAIVLIIFVVVSVMLNKKKD